MVVHQWILYANIGVKNSSIQLSFGNDQIDYNGEKLDELKAFENKEIVMGIRPEAFEDGNYANESEFSGVLWYLFLFWNN